MQHIFHHSAPTGRGEGTATSWFTAFLLAQLGRMGCALQPPLTLQQSDVHFKLSFISNCMLPVVIVQVVQVVHFYFGVFN